MLDKFLSVLFELDDLVEIRCTPRTRDSAERPKQFWALAEDIPDTQKRLETLNQQGKNIFVGVLPRTHQGGGTDEDCLQGRVIWADIEEMTAKTALRRLERLGIPSPTMALNSGNGVHAYWKLDQLAYPEDISICVYSLANYILSDAKVFNPSRVMRLPGYRNTKYTDSVKNCEIIHFEPDLTYSLSEFASKFPRTALPGFATQRKLPKDTSTPPNRLEVVKRAFIYLEAVPAVSEGEGRNNKAHELSKRLRDKGLDVSETYSTLRDGWNNRCGPPMDLQELYACVQSGYKYARKDAGCEPFEFAEEEEERAPRQRGRKRAERVVGEKEEKVSENKTYTEIALERFREQAEGKLNVVPLPWRDLAKDCPILYPRKCGIITGNPGACKTWFAMHLCKTVKDAGHKVKYLPLEDDLAYYLQRGAAISSGSWGPSKRVSQMDVDKRGRYLKRMAMKYGEHFEYWGDIVEENPTIREDGEIMAIDSEWILDWAEEACDDGARLIVIDSLAQIEFSGREEYKDQAKFWRRMLGIANRSGATILMIIHLSKTSGGNYGSIYSVEASKRFGDLAFSIVGLENINAEPTQVIGDDGLCSMEKINCVAHIMKCREGSLTHGPQASFVFGKNGPSFDCFGFLTKDDKNMTKTKK